MDRSGLILGELLAQCGEVAQVALQMSFRQVRILLGIYSVHYELFVPGWVASSESASLKFTVQ